jgi:hypothetical protein
MCVLCGRALRPFTVARDWTLRLAHRRCWVAAGGCVRRIDFDPTSGVYLGAPPQHEAARLTVASARRLPLALARSSPLGAAVGQTLGHRPDPVLFTPADVANGIKLRRLQRLRAGTGALHV